MGLFLVVVTPAKRLGLRASSGHGFPCITRLALFTAAPYGHRFVSQALRLLGFVGPRAWRNW
ncbi:hypothetical protein [Aurantiacibacter gangjinensis]|uniref:hypothetical protein n=1 Tax=Aurantiacibacter gangjinensis TaxID=502682 RepID=UPI0012E00520|nr:hypothetical protein [Aurantiacibacter gangjinensis]